MPLPRPEPDISDLITPMLLHRICAISLLVVSNALVGCEDEPSSAERTQAVENMLDGVWGEASLSFDKTNSSGNDGIEHRYYSFEGIARNVQDLGVEFVGDLGFETMNFVVLSTIIPAGEASAPMGGSIHSTNRGTGWAHNVDVAEYPYFRGDNPEAGVMPVSMYLDGYDYTVVQETDLYDAIRALASSEQALSQAVRESYGRIESEYLRKTSSHRWINTDYNGRLGIRTTNGFARNTYGTGIYKINIISDTQIDIRVGYIEYNRRPDWRCTIQVRHGGGDPGYVGIRLIGNRDNPSPELVARAQVTTNITLAGCSDGWDGQYSLVISEDDDGSFEMTAHRTDGVTRVPGGYMNRGINTSQEIHFN